MLVLQWFVPMHVTALPSVPHTQFPFVFGVIPFVFAHSLYVKHLSLFSKEGLLATQNWSLSHRGPGKDPGAAQKHSASFAAAPNLLAHTDGVEHLGVPTGAFAQQY
jgi:hypothetical protein